MSDETIHADAVADTPPQQKAGNASGMAIWGGIVAALVLGPYLVFAGLVLVETAMRMFIGRAMAPGLRDGLTGILAWVVAAGLLIGIPYAFARSLARPKAARTRIRTAFALWPGLLVGLILLVGGLAAAGMALTAPGALRSLVTQQMAPQLMSYVSAGLVLVLIAAAGFGGGRPANAASTVGSIVAMLFLVGLTVEASIGQLSVAAVGPSLAIVLFAAIAFGLGPWWPVLRIVLAAVASVVVGVMLIPGLITPTELASVLVALAIVAWLVRGLIVKDLWRTIDVAVVEVVPVLVALMAIVAVGIANSLFGWAATVAQSLPPTLGATAQLLIVLAAFAVLALILTPTVALVVIAPFSVPILRNSGIDLLLVGVLIAILSLLPMVLRRASRQDSGADPATQDLTGGQGALLALLIVVIALVGAVAPAFVLTLPTMLN